jgi:hypothetical protein
MFKLKTKTDEIEDPTAKQEFLNNCFNKLVKDSKFPNWLLNIVWAINAFVSAITSNIIRWDMEEVFDKKTVRFYTAYAKDRNQYYKEQVSVAPVVL